MNTPEELSSRTPQEIWAVISEEAKHQAKCPYWMLCVHDAIIYGRVGGLLFQKDPHIGTCYQRIRNAKQAGEIEIQTQIK